MTSSAAVSHGSFKVTRVQKNIIARSERALLEWICGRLPLWVTPDGLTIVGIFGAIIIFGSYVLSRQNPEFLWVSSFGFVINWFGDSLDGSLARHRRIERPIYGYFLDHTVDALNNLLIMAGIGLTLHVRLDVALFTLIGYYLLCIYVFINNHVSGVFRLSFIGFGPTELRLILVSINIWMFFCGHVGTAIGGVFFTPYDGVLLFGGTVFTLIFVTQVAIGVRTLRDPSRSGAVRPAVVSSPKIVQSVSRNASSALK